MKCIVMLRFSICCLFVFAICALQAQIIYINPSGAGNQSGSSWANAAPGTQLQTKINTAASGSQIWVAGGNYNSTNDGNRDSAFTILRGGLKIYGGYNAATGIRNIAANPTILNGDEGASGSADNSYHVVVITGLTAAADSLVLDGFTIKQGYATGTGSKMYNGAAVLRSEGAGIYLHSNSGAGGRIAIRNCTIANNVAQVQGGGIYNQSSSPTIVNCLFSYNGAYSTGGAAIFNSSNTQPAIVNCVFYDNHAGYGGIYNLSCTPIIANCTFSTNFYSVWNNNASPSISNSILWDNTNGAGTIPGINNEGSSAPVVTNSIVQGGYAGTGNLNADPLFINIGDVDGADNLFGTADDGLNVQVNSPAFNAGSNAAIPFFITTDITGAARIQNGTVDIGAYENFFFCPAYTTLYVNNSVATGGNGSSWATALKELKDALLIAQRCSNITTIYVAGGTYTPTNDSNRDSAFTLLRGGLKIYGGYNATTGIRNIAANPTTLNGDIGASGFSDNSYHVVVIAGLTAAADSLVLDGFTIKQGYATGTGSKMYNGAAVLRSEGAGIYLHSNSGAGGRIAIRNCTIANNVAQVQGGGIYNQSSSPTIVNCLFSYNGAYSTGGAAIFNSSNTQPAIVNCVFYDNHAGYGGIYNLSCTPIIANCTFSTNFYSVWNNNASPSISNSILWDNTNGAGTIPGINNEGSSAPVVTNSIVQGGYAGTGNLNADPLFINIGDVDGADNLFGTADDGLNVQVNSPAFNAGSNAAIPFFITTDITGAARILNGTVDIGAYEKFACPATTRIYVDSSVAVSGSGESWGSAFKELQDAVQTARQCTVVDTILVAKGTYKPTANSDRDSAFTFLQGGVKIYGGYPTGGGARNIAANPTILSGDIGQANTNNDNSYHIIIINGIGAGSDSLIFDGLSITGGYANGNNSKYYGGQIFYQTEGGGICISNTNAAAGKIALRNCNFYADTASSNGGALYNRVASPTISNCTFTNNYAGGHAGAIYNYDHASPTISRCAFTSNKAADGGAMYNYSYSSPAISNTVFITNTAGGRGGAVYSQDNASPVFTACTFQLNSADNGGALSTYFYAPLTVTNCVFVANNASSDGGAIATINNCPSTITNSTFTDNNATYGGAMNNYLFSNPTITNSILWGNTGTYPLFDNSNSVVDINYSIVQGGYTGTANLNTAPLFTNSSDPDGADNIFGTVDDGLNLQFGSPAVNAGNNAAIPAGTTTDIRGVARIQNSTVDMGAYESNLVSIFTFTGTGNWNTVTNWLNSQMPPSPLPAGYEVIINPASGNCVLNVPFTVAPGGKLTVKTGKNLVVPGNIQVH